MSKHRKKTGKQWLMFALRWGVAIVGITYVVAKINFHDHVKVLDPSTLQLADMQVLGDPPADAPTFRVRGTPPGESHPSERVVPRDQVWTDRSNRSTVDVPGPAGEPVALAVRGIRPASVAADGTAIPPQILVEDPDTHRR